MGRIMVGGNGESRKRRTDTVRYEKGLRLCGPDRIN